MIPYPIGAPTPNDGYCPGGGDFLLNVAPFPASITNDIVTFLP
jgi:hypothetical protein